MKTVAQCSAKEIRLKAGPGNTWSWSGAPWVRDSQAVAGRHLNAVMQLRFIRKGRAKQAILVWRKMLVLFGMIQYSVIQRKCTVETDVRKKPYKKWRNKFRMTSPDVSLPSKSRTHLLVNTMLPAFGRQHHGGCITPQAVTHRLVLLKMGKIISRNMLSWLELRLMEILTSVKQFRVQTSGAPFKHGHKLLFPYNSMHFLTRYAYISFQTESLSLGPLEFLIGVARWSFE